MSKKTVDSDTSSDNVNSSIIKSSHSLTGNTKMFILPPNVLQNICIGDSIAKGGHVISALELIKKDNTVSTVKIQENEGHEISTSMGNTNSSIVIKPTTAIKVNKIPPDNTESKSSINATEVPKRNANKKKLISKANHTEQMKKDLHTIVEKQKNSGKVDSSIDVSRKQKTLKKLKCTTKNLENNETTSNDVPKPQRINTRSGQCSSEKYLNKNLEKQKRVENKCKVERNLLGRSKRVRKQTNFDDYITSFKNEIASLDMKKKDTPNKDQKQAIISNISLSDTTKTNNIFDHVKYTKEELENKNNERNIATFDSHTTSTSITPAVTEKSLPLSSSNTSGNHSSIKRNEKEIYTEHLQNSVDQNDKRGNKVHIKAMSTFVLECTIKQENDVETTSKFEGTNDTSDNNINIDESRVNLTPATLTTPSNQESLTTSTISQSGNDQTSTNTPMVRKKGRPRKIISTLEQTADISKKSEEKLHVPQKISEVSIAETVVHSKRHNEKSYNVSNNDCLSDDSSTEDNIPKPITVRKRGRPPGSCAGKSTERGRGRGKGRGKGRGRGRGRGSYHTTLDSDYIPKLKGPITPDKTKGKDSDESIANVEEVDLITCAKCETKMTEKQWSSHNLYKHNDTSWIEGDEPMNFENDVKLWRKVLMNAIKKRRGQLSCEQCGTVKRSANGFISHMQFCGKSDEEKQALLVNCPICGAIMMPSSMEIHERTHRQSESKESKLKVLQFFSAETEKVKRKAAEKAVTKILEFTDSLVKDSNVPPEKKMKLEPSLLKSVIKTPEQNKSIPSVWKGIWKKELASQGTAKCRQTGCTYTCTSLEDICKHSSECTFIPHQCYLCKICKFSTISNEDMIKHVEEEHTTVEGIDKNTDFEEEYFSSDERTFYTMNFLNKEQHCKIRWSEPYLPTVRWTMEFERKNYKLHLFNDYLPNHFTLLNNTDAIKYLPELEVSMRTKQKSSSENSHDTEIPWKQWKRFEGGFDEGTSIFFTGGPVWALAWLPIPSPMYSKEPYQYVAISSHPTMESEYTIGKSYSGHNMIQIWNVGPLNYKASSKRESPALSYAIVHDSGTIWCLEWCPSGCYQDESLNNYKKETETQSSLKRMGMLAAACSDGNIHIYSLPFPEELQFKKTTDNEWPIYCTDPIITLVVNLSMYDNNDQNWQCTKLSWTKEHGHNTIAAGFSNGYIALWDLTYKSPLLVQKRQNTYFVNAFQHFYAHGNAVSMVALVPYNGERFLASGSLDRSYKFWNLDDTNIPQTTSQKSIILDGAWMTHWPCAVICFDDALKYKHTNTYLLSLRDHEFKYYPILGINSPAYTLAVSDYANSIAHGTLAGEIISIFAHELVHTRDIEKAVQKKRKLSSFIKIVDFSKTKLDSKDNEKNKENSNDYVYMPETYNQCQNRFGIIFCDNLTDIERYVQQPSLYPEKLTTVPIEEYPFMSVNRISWNPNAWSYLWMSAGYQNGLVRLLNFKYMPMTRELKTLLPHHVKSVLNKEETTARKC